MKIILIVLASIVFTFPLYSQEETKPEETAKKNMVHIEGGILVTNLGLGDGIIINCGYEGFTFDFLSTYADLGVWIMSDTLVSGNFGVLLHPVPQYAVDPFVGISITYGIWVNNKQRAVDIPFVAGANLMVNDSFGFRIFGKLYLFSLRYLTMIEIDAGFVLKF